MEELDTYITGLTSRVGELAASRTKLQSENNILKNRNKELEQTVTEQKNVLIQLKEQNKVAKIAKAVTEDDDDRREQRKRLNELVREVDKCIALLNN